MASTLTKVNFFYESLNLNLVAGLTKMFTIGKLVMVYSGYTLNAPTVCDVVSWLLSHASFNFVRIKPSTLCMFEIFLN